MKEQIGFFVGSLRKDAYSKKVAKTLAELLPENYEAVFVDLGQLALYNQDLDDEHTPPQTWIDFRKAVKPLVGAVFVTPEYNRSVPGVLKNALDVGSRPYGESVWDGKPGLVVSVSPGGLSGFGANHHLRQSLVFLNIPTLQQPEAYIGHIADLLNEDGSIVEGTRDYLKLIMNAYLDFLARNKK